MVTNLQARVADAPVPFIQHVYNASKVSTLDEDLPARLRNGLIGMN